MVRIGIIIKPLRMFSNGLIQNAFFMYEVFRAHHTCALLCYDAAYTHLEGTNIPVQTIPHIMTEDETRAFDVLITVGHGVTPETYANCVRTRTRVISFVCGNVLANTMIGFVDRDASTPSAVLVSKTTPADHIWIIGGHSYMKSFVEVTRCAPSTLVPHLWSPRLMESYMESVFKRNKSALQYVYDKKEPQYNILILEPNLEFVKNAVIPITICERLHTLDPSVIREVFVFNFPDTSKTATTLVDHCRIRDKVRRFKGLHIAEILSFFNAQPQPYIVVSHQINNPWNYLYYEMLHFGVPLVHNSPAFRSYGYYYEGCDIDHGADACRNAVQHHSRLRPIHGPKNAAFLATIDPYAADCQTHWNTLLSEELAKMPAPK